MSDVVKRCAKFFRVMIFSIFEKRPLVLSFSLFICTSTALAKKLVARLEHPKILKEA